MVGFTWPKIKSLLNDWKMSHTIQMTNAFRLFWLSHCRRSHFLMTPLRADCLGTHFIFWSFIRWATHGKDLFFFSKRLQSSHLHLHTLGRQPIIRISIYFNCPDVAPIPQYALPLQAGGPPSPLNGLICCHRLTQALRPRVFKLSGRRLHTCRRLVV